MGSGNVDRVAPAHEIVALRARSELGYEQEKGGCKPTQILRRHHRPRD